MWECLGQINLQGFLMNTYNMHDINNKQLFANQPCDRAMHNKRWSYSPIRHGSDIPSVQYNGQLQTSLAEKKPFIHHMTYFVLWINWARHWAEPAATESGHVDQWRLANNLQFDEAVLILGSKPWHRLCKMGEACVMQGLPVSEEVQSGCVSQQGEGRGERELRPIWGQGPLTYSYHIYRSQYHFTILYNPTLNILMMARW